MTVGLHVEKVSVSFGGNKAVDDVSFELDSGQIMGIIGPNGAGKSTTLNAIAGLVVPDQGTITLNGQDVTTKPFWRRCRAGLAMTFQTPQSDQNLTVAEQLLGQLRSVRHLFLGPGARAGRERVHQLLDEMDLHQIAERRTDSLTLGEIRRFEFARAVANEPTVLLVDEPSSGMTADESKLLALTIQRIADRGVAVILIEHNIPFVRALAENIVVLDLGKIIASGATSDVLASDIVKEAYLGTAKDDA